MKVGIIGSGGREHAICENLKKSNKIEQIYCLPGNAGTAKIAENIILDLENFKDVKNFVLEKNLDLVIVGPEKPLVDGLVDGLGGGLGCFGGDLGRRRCRRRRRRPRRRRRRSLQ